MIEDIAIRNLGVIAEANVRPGPGLTVLTGETGAGKTMVLTSISLLLGRKADPGEVRHGQDACTVDGIFLEPVSGPAHAVLHDAGGLTDDDEIVLGRTVPRSGRSRAVAGGRAVPAGILAEAGSHLVTVHGQADQMALRQSAHQRRLLDEAGGDDHADLCEDYRRAWRQWQEATAQVERARADAAQIREERDRLRAGLAVLDDLAPEPDEDARLLAEIDRLSNVEDLRVAVTTAHDALAGPSDRDGDCLGALALAHRALERVSGLDPALADYAAGLRDASVIVQDAAASLASYLDDLSADPRHLDHAQQRLADLRRGYAPYAVDVAGFLAWADNARERLRELDDPGHSVEALEEAQGQAHQRLCEAAAALSASRKALARELEDAIRTELASLAMADARLSITITPCPVRPSGADEVTFGLADPEGRVRPLGSGASGGELSRIMLALEAALIDRREPTGRPTLVFDEVDAGIGGATATAVGQRLARLAERYQVIVVTHLAQVAACATTHLVVRRDDETTRLVEVRDDERVSEIARMLSGESDSQTARAHAAELLRDHTVA